MRETLRRERDQNERHLILVGAELEAKEQQIRSLHGRHSSEESLHQELLQADVELPSVLAEIPVDSQSTQDSSASNGPSTTLLHQTVVRFPAERITNLLLYSEFKKNIRISEKIN